MDTTTKTLEADTGEAVEALRALYWEAVNTRDAWRRHANPRLNLAAFTLHEAVEVIGGVLMRHLEHDTKGDN